MACGLMLALCTGGCSTFNRDWRSAAAAPPPENAFSGRWEGSWLSAVNGHHGKLRCLVTPIDGSQFRARFKATYWKIFRVSYAVNMQGAPESAGALNFRGETDLGWWGGGVYRYDGNATPTNFFSIYQSKYDHGTFRLTRPEK